MFLDQSTDQVGAAVKCHTTRTMLQSLQIHLQLDLVLDAY
jgi:hypothetical protein